VTGEIPMSLPGFGARRGRTRPVGTVEGLLAPILTVAALIVWRDSPERLDPAAASMIGLALACSVGGMRNNEGFRRVASGLSLLAMAVPLAPLVGSLSWYLVRWAWSGREYVVRLVGG
jgi:hypothetical protein